MSWNPITDFNTGGSLPDWASNTNFAYSSGNLLGNQPGSSGGNVAGKFWDSLKGSFSDSLGKAIPSLFQNLLNPQQNYQKMMTDAAVIPQAMASIAQSFDQYRQLPLAEAGAGLQEMLNARSAFNQRDIFSPVSRSISLQDLEFSRDQNASERADRYQGDPTLNFKSPASLDSDPSVFSTPKLQNNPFFARLMNRS